MTPVTNGGVSSAVTPVTDGGVSSVVTLVMTARDGRVDDGITGLERRLAAKRASNLANTSLRFASCAVHVRAQLLDDRLEPPELTSCST